MNNPDSAQYKIELNERRGDETFQMHDINSLLKVFFNKEKEIALEKWGHDVLSCGDFMSSSLCCTRSTQNHLPVVPFIPFDHLTSIPFFVLLCETVSSQNISQLVVFVTDGLRKRQCSPFKATTGESNHFLLLLCSPISSLLLIYRLRFGGRLRLGCCVIKLAEISGANYLYPPV